MAFRRKEDNGPGQVFAKKSIKNGFNSREHPLDISSGICVIRMYYYIAQKKQGFVEGVNTNCK